MRAARAFPPTVASIASARRFVAGALAEAGVDGERAGVVVLVVSELATNAVLHAASPYEVTVECDGRVRIEVADESPERPQVLAPGPKEIGGRGMQLVDQLGHRWGVEPTAGGKCVWWEDGAATDRSS